MPSQDQRNSSKARGRFSLQGWLNSLMAGNIRSHHDGNGEQPRISSDLPTRLDNLCNKLLNLRDDAAAGTVAREVIALYELLEDDGKIRLLTQITGRIQVDLDKARAAAEAFVATPGHATLAMLSDSTTTLGQLFLSRMNQAPSGTNALVRMRADLLRLKSQIPDADLLDHSFAEMFRIWFNRGFLDLARIDWSVSADLLEKIIQYEAVHAIDGWEDLRNRVQPRDRLLFGFFHHRLNGEPLIFVEIALTRGKPASIDDILATRSAQIDPEIADTAVFYSISNCHAGLRGVPLGNLLIKQVVDELRQTFPQLANFVTLSPVPGFAKWLSRRIDKGESALPAGWDSIGMIHEHLRRGAFRDKDAPNGNGELEAYLSRETAFYLTSAKDDKNRVSDPVGRFHLGNGARLERINFAADTSQKGLDQALGMMVNYEYQSDEIEENCDRLAQTGQVALSGSVAALLDASPADKMKRHGKKMPKDMAADTA